MKVPITREGYANLKKEHENLLNVKRPKILKAIEEARGHGDLSENAEYDAAKEEFQFLQKKVAEIEEMIKNSEIIDKRNGDFENVEFGCTVTLVNLDTDEEAEYRLVGPYESDINREPYDRLALEGRFVGICGERVELQYAPGASAPTKS